MSDNGVQILFICTGNTCRSPMAEYLVNASAMAVKAVSAGLYAFDGEAMSANSLAVLAESGIDGRPFRSQSVTWDLVNDSSLILTMTSSHRRELLKRYPQAEKKCFTLLQGSEVSDPYGENCDVYRKTMTEIRRGIADWMEFLTKQ